MSALDLDTEKLRNAAKAIGIPLNRYTMAIRQGLYDQTLTLDEHGDIGEYLNAKMSTPKYLMMRISAELLFGAPPCCILIKSNDSLINRFKTNYEKLATLDA